MEENKPPETDTSSETTSQTHVQESDALDQVNPIGDVVEEKGDEDVEAQGQGDQKEEKAMDLTLAELNELAGRKEDNAFKSKEDYQKHYKNLSSLVGDQKAVEERKEEVNPSENTANELAELKKELATKDFLDETPTAKDNIDVIEAYAEKNGIDLSEAWSQIGDKFATSGDSNVIKTNNRINPVQSQKISDLAKNARSGDNKAQESLVEEYLGTSKGKL